MSLEHFISANKATWSTLEALVGEAGTRSSKLSDDKILRLGALYRATTADLAQARRQYPDDHVVSQLESLVLRSRSLVYAKSRKSGGIIDFYSRVYWQLLVERRAILALATGLLLVPAAFGALLALVRPELGATLVPSAFLWVTEPRPEGTDLGLTGTQLASFSTFVLTNNIRVTLLAFAAGITWGIGTAASMIFNGLILGAVTGLAVSAGNGALIVEAIVAHGILEISCIVAGAVAGLRMASGLVKPGTRTRRAALVEEARPAALLALGTVPFLVVAGFVEGFVSRTGTTAGPAVAIGLALGGGYWLLAATRGSDQSWRAALARR